MIRHCYRPDTVTGHRMQENSSNMQQHFWLIENKIFATQCYFADENEFQKLKTKQQQRKKYRMTRSRNAYK